METFKIIYKDIDGNTKATYMQGEQASDAAHYAEQEIWDLMEILRIEQI